MQMLQSDWILYLYTVNHKCRIVQLVSKMASRCILAVFRSFSNNLLIDAILQRTKYAPQQVTCLNTSFCLPAYRLFTFKNKTSIDKFISLNFNSVLCFLLFLRFVNKVWLFTKVWIDTLYSCTILGRIRNLNWSHSGVRKLLRNFWFRTIEDGFDRSLYCHCEPN